MNETGFTPARDESSVPATTPTEAVVLAVAERADASPTELPPLYEFLDPDALERLVGGHASCRVTFRYAGYELTVTGPEQVTVREPDRVRSGDST